MGRAHGQQRAGADPFAGKLGARRGSTRDPIDEAVRSNTTDHLLALLPAMTPDQVPRILAQVENLRRTQDGGWVLEMAEWTADCGGPEWDTWNNGLAQHINSFVLGLGNDTMLQLTALAETDQHWDRLPACREFGEQIVARVDDPTELGITLGYLPANRPTSQFAQERLLALFAKRSSHNQRAAQMHALATAYADERKGGRRAVAYRIARQDALDHVGTGDGYVHLVKALEEQESRNGNLDPVLMEAFTTNASPNPSDPALLRAYELVLLNPHMHTTPVLINGVLSRVAESVQQLNCDRHSDERTDNVAMLRSVLNRMKQLFASPQVKPWADNETLPRLQAALKEFDATNTPTAAVGKV